MFVVIVGGGDSAARQVRVEQADARPPGAHGAQGVGPAGRFVDDAHVHAQERVTHSEACDRVGVGEHCGRVGRHGRRSPAQASMLLSPSLPDALPARPGFRNSVNVLPPSSLTAEACESPV